jgi:hypothetical protein
VCLPDTRRSLQRPGASGTPRLLFKGEPSLSKSFWLIDRFSEDINITVIPK